MLTKSFHIFSLRVASFHLFNIYCGNRSSVHSFQYFCVNVIDFYVWVNNLHGGRNRILCAICMNIEFTQTRHPDFIYTIASLPRLLYTKWNFNVNFTWSLWMNQEMKSLWTMKLNKHEAFTRWLNHNLLENTKLDRKNTHNRRKFTSWRLQATPVSLSIFLWCW